jgi:hypothetical protein
MILPLSDSLHTLTVPPDTVLSSDAISLPAQIGLAVVIIAVYVFMLFLGEWSE